MARALHLTGTFTALYTPFAIDGGVDLVAYRALCERLIDAGSGLVPCGTTGETPTLRDDEYLACIKTAVEVSAGRVPVIAGTGGSCTRRTIETTRAAREAGCDAALVVTPPYNKPPQCSLLAHFQAVADGGGLPIVLYNVPGRTGSNMLPETVLKLAADPRFVAVKEAAGNMAQIQALIAGAPDGFSVLSGDDAMTLPLIAAGGDGVVSVASNVVPHSMVKLVNAALGGELDAARRQHGILAPLFRALFATANPIPVKYAALLLGQARADVRLPLTGDAMTQPMIESLSAALARVQQSTGLGAPA